MAKNNEKHILVYTDWAGLDEPTFMGTLAATPSRGTEIFSFEYDEAWLSNPKAQNLDPDLALYGGRQYLADGKYNFGIFLDSSPDRWGRTLMKRREAIMARHEGRKEATLTESDFLLGVFDLHRMGALRFKLEPDGDFLNNNRNFATPPWAALRDLEYASKQYEQEELDDAESLKWLNMLIAPGSSLGGARPKASVIDTKGNLWIAKFPSNNDEIDIGAWEMVANQLAKQAGVAVPNAKVQVFTGKHHTLLSQRFDRDKNNRVHFASAMTLLGHVDGDNYTKGISYLELAGFIQQFGGNVGPDLEELWRRIVFNICISNTDDHLRNHGFLLTHQGWTLAPAYDMNPVARGTGLTLNISETDNSLNLDLARSTAPYFRLKTGQAEKIIGQVTAAVKQWPIVAGQFGIPQQQILPMQNAFSHF